MSRFMIEEACLEIKFTSHLYHRAFAVSYANLKSINLYPLVCLCYLLMDKGYDMGTGCFTYPVKHRNLLTHLSNKYSLSISIF